MPDLTFPSFSGGEAAPAYYGRTDQDAFYVSAKALLNYIASQTGPAIGRGGTTYVAGTKNNGASKVLLVPFQFNEEQAYICEFGDGYIRFYKDRGRIDEAALNITGVTKDDPAVVTVNHRLTKGRTIRIASVAGMTELNGNSYLVDHVLGASKNIDDLDRSSPVRIEIATGHGFVGGERVFIESVGGMTEVNDRTFELVSIFDRVLAITGISQENPAVVTVSGVHALNDGEAVLIEDVAGMTEVNDRRFVISLHYSATKNISDITQANPGVVTTSTAHGFAYGSLALLDNVGGMTEVNDDHFTVGRVFSASNQLNGDDEGLAFQEGASPVIVVSPSHGLSNGTKVWCDSFGYAVELNDREFTVANAQTDAYELEGSDSSTVTRPPLDEKAKWHNDPSGFVRVIDLTKFSIGVDTTGFGAYTSGGTAQELFPDQFELDSEDATGHTAYTSGGTATRVLVDDFYLKDENGLTHTAYTSGGTVKQVSETSLKLQDLDGNDVDSTGFGTYTSGGTVTAIHEIASPYDIDDLFDADELPLLQFTQSADFLFLAHPDYAPMQLTRSGHADWAISEFINEEGPFLDENLEDTNIYVEDGGTLSRGGVVTLISDTPLWESGHVGAMWEVRLKDGATAPAWVTGTAFVLGDEVLSNNLFYRCTDAGTSGTEAPSHDIGEAYDGADTATNCKWRYIHNGRGIVIVTSFVNAQEVVATVISELPAGTVGESNETGRWKEGAWSAVQGYPRSVATHEGRLAWGGTAQEPLAMDFSSTESLFFYNPVELDGTVTRASAFRRVLDSNNPIRWLKSTEKGLIVGTLAGEWIVATEGVTQGFGPDTAVARQFSANGAAAIQPIRNGDSILYPQRARKRMRDITFSLDQQKLVTSDRNLRADHILLAGVCDVAYAEEPHRVTWCRLGNGRLAGLTYNREPGAQVSAWHRHVIGGAFSGGDAIVESIAVIPGPDETTDDLWLSVKRTINGNTVRYVEWMRRPLDYGGDIEDGVYMDSAISYSGSPVTNISGADHLEGETVDVLADGVYTTKVISGGAFSVPLSTAASDIHVGQYTKRQIETMFLESAPGDRVNTKALKKRVVSAQIEVVESAKGWIGTNEDDLDQMVFDDFASGSGAPARTTGFVEENVNDEFGKRKSVIFEQREPYPTMIASITPRFEVEPP